jgi:hypothetical protein
VVGLVRPLNDADRLFRQTVNSLEQAGLISWDAEADAKPGASGPAKFGLTHYGFAVCEREFGPRRSIA